MRIWHGRKPDVPPLRRAVATIGMFDGVHRGHQRLIQTTVRWAKRLHATSVVVTFHPDPQQVLNAYAPPPLTSLERRLELINELGVDVVWVLPFTRAFSRLTPEAFVHEVLRARLRAAAVVVGETFAFGRDRRGDLRMLRALGRREGMRVVVVPPVRRGGAAVSSSRIRALLQQGQWRRAAQLLGHPVELAGSVIRGAGRGARLGFPTANLALGRTVTPPHGVYAVDVLAAGRRWPGVMNVGVRPTFAARPSGSARSGLAPPRQAFRSRPDGGSFTGTGGVPAAGSSTVCEVYLEGFRGRLYGRRLTVLLRARLRDERKFATPEALARQISRDVGRAREVLASHS